MTTTYPLVSIIIPVYNRADYIEEALNSIFQEEYPNLEVVVIDDGSTDNTKDIIENWMSKQSGSLLTQFISRENKGVVATLNDLIEASKGQYIVFFGSDDCLLNNGIIKRYEYLQKHPEKYMVIGDCTLIDGASKPLHESAFIEIGKANKELMKTDEGLIEYTLMNGYYPGATLMADKAIYREFGLYDTQYSAEDWPYYSRVVAKGRLGFLDETVSAYRLHNSNMCFSRTQLKIAKEQLHQMFTLLPVYTGKHRALLLQRMLYQLFYIPYMTIKFELLDFTETNKDKPLSWQEKVASSTLNALLGLKTLVMGSLKNNLGRS